MPRRWGCEGSCGTHTAYWKFISDVSSWSEFVDFFRTPSRAAKAVAILLLGLSFGADILGLVSLFTASVKDTCLDFPCSLQSWGLWQQSMGLWFFPSRPVQHQNIFSSTCFSIDAPAVGALYFHWFFWLSALMDGFVICLESSFTALFSSS